MVHTQQGGGGKQAGQWYLKDNEVAGLRKAHTHLTAVPFLQNSLSSSHALSGSQQRHCYKGNAICNALATTLSSDTTGRLALLRVVDVMM